MLDWRKISRHRERELDDLPEEELTGSGRTTTMLVNAIDFLIHDNTAISPNCVVVIPFSVMIEDFKLKTRAIVEDLGLFVTNESSDSLWINNHKLKFVVTGSPEIKGMNKAFFDHSTRKRLSTDKKEELCSQTHPPNNAPSLEVWKSPSGDEIHIIRHKQKEK